MASIKNYTPEELRQTYFEETGKKACHDEVEYYQDYSKWLEDLHCRGEVYGHDIV